MSTQPIEDFPEWRDADRISDRIVEIAREEVGRGTSPLQLFAGELLALMSLLNTAEGLDQPLEMILVGEAVKVCLDKMVNEPRRQRQKAN